MVTNSLSFLIRRDGGHGSITELFEAEHALHSKWNVGIRRSTFNGGSATGFKSLLPLGIKMSGDTFTNVGMHHR